MFSPQCPSSLSCVNGYLAIDGGGNDYVYMSSLCGVIEALMNYFHRSRVDVGMHRSAGVEV